MLVTRATYHKYQKAQKKVSIAPQIESFPEDYEEFLATIQMRSGGEIKPFNIYQHQRLLIRLIKKYPVTTIVKTRQTGISQIVLGWMLHQANINPAYLAAFFTRGGDELEKFGARFKRLCEESGTLLKKDKDNHYILENNAELVLYNTGKHGSRGLDSLLLAVFDEMAFINNILSIYSASTASLTLTGDRGRIVNISTPSGQSGLFWKLLNEDNNTGKTIEQICKEVSDCTLYSDNLPGFYWFEDYSGNCKVFIHWRCHPVYKLQDDFVEAMQKRYVLSDEAAQREYNLVFLDPAIQVFSPDAITKCEYKIDLKFLVPKYCSVGIYFSTSHTALIAVDDKGFVIDYYRENSLDSNVIMETLKCFYGKNYVKQVAIQSANGGKKIAKEIRQKYENMTVIEVKNSEFAEAIVGLQLALRKEEIWVPRYFRKKDPPIAQELRNFRKQGTKFVAADEGRDEYVWALAFAVMASEYSVRQLPMGSG